MRSITSSFRKYILSNDHDQGSVLGARSIRDIKKTPNPFSCLDTDRNNLTEREWPIDAEERSDLVRGNGLSCMRAGHQGRGRHTTQSHREGSVYGQRPGIHPPDKTVGAHTHLCWGSFFSLTRKQGYQLRERVGKEVREVWGKKWSGI